MHSALVSSVRILWNGCRELSDKERVHELKVNKSDCHCIVASWHQCSNKSNVILSRSQPGVSFWDTDTFFSPSYQVYQTDVIWLYEKYESMVAFRVTPMQDSELSDGGKRRLPQANPVHQCRYLLLLGTPSELKTVLSGKNSHVGRPPPSPSMGIFSTKYRFFLKMSQSEKFKK